MRSIILFTAIAFALLTSCTSSSKAEYLNRKEAEKVAAEHVYYSKEGLSLRLTEQEAQKKGISPKDYKDFQDIVVKGNEMLTENLASLGENDSINFAFPKERFEAEGVDPRIILQIEASDTLLFSKDK